MALFTVDEVLALRMRNMLLAARESRSPAEVASWMGALQAQDLASAEWSFGIRCAGLTQSDIHQATVDRQILRTWPMRGTVHFVPPTDAKWMLELAGARVLAGAAGRRAQLGLSETTARKAAEVLHDALHGGRSLTRAQCVERLIDAGLHTAPEHGYHLLWYASQIGVTCIGPQQGKEQTFVLLDEWVKNPTILSRDESLATLALRYFQSHGPAPVKDFAGWTGLTVGDAKRGIELNAAAVTSITTVSGPMITSTASIDDPMPLTIQDDAIVLLPGFDEYVLGYKDRTAIITPEHMNKIVPGGNGIFKPTIVANGRVIGIWKREVKKHRVTLQAFPFSKFTSKHRQAFINASHMYADYLQLDPEIINP